MTCRFTAIVMCCLLSVASVADTVSGPDALARLGARLASFDRLSADFNQRIYSTGNSAMQESSGELKVAKPLLFEWTTNLPYPQTVVTDGLQVIVYDPDLEQATVRPLADALSDTPASLLTGDMDAIASSFSVVATTDLPSELFLLKPLAEDSLYASLSLGFDDGVLDSLEVTDHLGQVTLVRFGNVDTSVEFAEDEFSVSLPEGTDIIGDLMDVSDERAPTL
ncbi:MAG: outer membrane lipoprotein chaperone LolA [Pseudomonadaceae bacterium]|nr:outer membrane lipoprotein chaperone LolA [Pseudomonadaceae bacterium]